MKKSTTNNTSREVIFTESKTMREEYIKEEYFDILDKIKAIPYMTKDMVVSVEQVANYYEVTKKAIETVIKRNKDEIESDGYMVLKGEELKEFKNKICLLHGGETNFIKNKTRSLALLTKKAMITIGFFLQNNQNSQELQKRLLKKNPNIYAYFKNKTYKTNHIKKYENEFFDMINRLLGKYNKIDKQVKCGKYHIDFVINDYIAIEIDENGHKYYSKIEEAEREKNIKNNNYKLFRYNPMKEDIFIFIGELIHELNNKN